MPAYVILTREKTRNEAKLKEYRQLVPASFQKHPGANATGPNTIPTTTSSATTPVSSSSWPN